MYNTGEIAAFEKKLKLLREIAPFNDSSITYTGTKVQIQTQLTDTQSTTPLALKLNQLDAWHKIKKGQVLIEFYHPRTYSLFFHGCVSIFICISILVFYFKLKEYLLQNERNVL